jgi:hypothetical protein
MTCEFASLGHTASCRTCGLVLGTLGSSDCPRRREANGAGIRTCAGNARVGAPGRPIRPDPVHLTAPP